MRDCTCAWKSLVVLVFFAVSRNLRGFERRPSGEGSFRGWLWVITRNKIRDWARGQRPDEAAGGSSAARRLANAALDIGDESESTTDHEISELFERGLAQVRPMFEPQTWEAFWRTVIDGQSTALVAQQLDLTSGFPAVELVGSGA